MLVRPCLNRSRVWRMLFSTRYEKCVATAFFIIVAFSSVAASGGR